MAIWDFALAFDSGLPGDDLRATVEYYWWVSGGGPSGSSGFPTITDALRHLMQEGWEPFSANRVADTSVWGKMEEPQFPDRDYFWFRRERKPQRTTTARRGATEARPPRG